MDGAINSVASFPAYARRSITFDRGCSFSRGPPCNSGSGSNVVLHPTNPLAEGMVENTNGASCRDTGTKTLDTR